MKSYRYLFLVLSTITCLTAFSSQPLVRNFTRKDYKSGTQNWSITQDNNNRMCFANNNGILIYDGKNWQTLPINNGTNVRSVAYGGNGRVYASTFNEFGYYENDKNGKLQYYTLTNQEAYKSTSSNEIFNIHKAGNRIYFQGEDAVYHYENNKLSRLSTGYKIESSAVVHNMFLISTQRNGIFMLNGDMFIRIQGSEMLENKKVCAFLPYRKNEVLIVTRFHGVYKFDGLSVTPFNSEIDNYLKYNQVFCAATNGRLLVYGTVQRGIVILDIETGKTSFLNSYNGLQNNTILSVYFDNQDNLWLGLDKGIDYVLLNSPVRNIFSTNSIYGSGYVSYIKGNVIYFGTNQGLYYTGYPLPNNDLPLQLSMIRGMEGQIWCLDEIDNTLFCGDDQGAFIINGGSIERIEGLSGTWKFKKLKKSPDKIIGCSYQGLFILSKSSGKWKLSHFLKGRFKESSPMFVEDEDGKIWFSHWQKGLYRLHLNANADSIIKIDLFDSNKGFPTNRNNTVFSIGKEIIFSSEQGLYKFNRKTDSMVPHDAWNKLFSSTPSYLRLHEGNNGDIWCVSGRFLGLAKKQKNNSYIIDSLSYKILQPKLIVGFEHFNYLNKNTVILNTEDGFSLLKTDFQINDRKIFKVYLSGVFAIGSKNTSISLLTNNQDNFIPKIKKTTNTVRFEISAPEYQNEGLVQYSYMLDGYDKDWSAYTLENTKEYNQLPKGKYIFKIKARNLLLADEASYDYTFVISPAWYESILAFIIYGIILIALIIRLIIFINHRSLQGAIEMEKRKEIEIQEQKKIFEAENQAKKREIKELKNQQLQYELRHKSQELASSTMNLIRKNEILLEIIDNINKTIDEIGGNKDKNSILQRLSKLEKNIRQNIGNDNNWKKFEANFDLVYENYLKRLGEEYPDLNVCDKKICAYIKMDLSSKDMAPLINMTVRSIETSRYRIRQKLGLGRDVNLSDFLQKY